MKDAQEPDHLNPGTMVTRLREGRFDQLSHLRNCIRHSRQVTEIGRKDGEAALLWFPQASEL